MLKEQLRRAKADLDAARKDRTRATTDMLTQVNAARAFGEAQVRV